MLVNSQNRIWHVENVLEKAEDLLQLPITHSLRLSAALLPKQEFNVVAEPNLQNFKKMFSSTWNAQATDTLHLVTQGRCFVRDGSQVVRAAEVHGTPTAHQHLGLGSS